MTTAGWIEVRGALTGLPLRSTPAVEWRPHVIPSQRSIAALPALNSRYRWRHHPANTPAIATHSQYGADARSEKSPTSKKYASSMATIAVMQ